MVGFKDQQFLSGFACSNFFSFCKSCQILVSFRINWHQMVGGGGVCVSILGEVKHVSGHFFPPDPVLHHLVRERRYCDLTLFPS